MKVFQHFGFVFFVSFNIHVQLYFWFIYFNVL